MLHIQAFYKSIQPQTLIQQITTFAIQAQQYKNDELTCQRFAIIPHGNRLHTGMIQALAYYYLSQTPTTTTIMLIPHETITIPIITTQTQTNNILGAPLTIDQSLTSTLQKSCHSDDQAISTNTAWTNQLPFLRILHHQPIYPILIPTKNTTQRKQTQTKLNQRLTNHPDTSCICISNYATNKKQPKARQYDQQLLAHFQADTTQRRLPNTAHFKYMASLAQRHNHPRQLALYANTGDMGADTDNTTTHCCLLA